MLLRIAMDAMANDELLNATQALRQMCWVFSIRIQVAGASGNWRCTKHGIRMSRCRDRKCKRRRSGFRGFVMSEWSAWLPANRSPKRFHVQAESRLLSRQNPAQALIPDVAVPLRNRPEAIARLTDMLRFPDREGDAAAVTLLLAIDPDFRPWPAGRCIFNTPN